MGTTDPNKDDSDSSNSNNLNVLRERKLSNVSTIGDLPNIIQHRNTHDTFPATTPSTPATPRARKVTSILPPEFHNEKMSRQTILSNGIRDRKISNILPPGFSSEKRSQEFQGLANVIRARKISSHLPPTQVAASTDGPVDKPPTESTKGVRRARRTSFVKSAAGHNNAHDHGHGHGPIHEPILVNAIIRERKISTLSADSGHGPQEQEIWSPESIFVNTIRDGKIHEPSIASVDKNEIRERKISILLTPNKLADQDDFNKRPDQLPFGQIHMGDTIYEMDYEVHSPSEKLVPRKRTQILAAIAANMGGFALGAVLAWSATALPSLRKSEDFSDITASEEAWIGSIVTLGALGSCPAAAMMMVNFGRRRSMMLLTAPFVFGWALIAFSNVLPHIGHPVYTIYLGRILTGFCGGAFTVIAPVYIAESADEKIRGGLGSGFDLMLSFGFLYIYVIGAYTSWHIQAILCGIIPLIFHAIAMFVPESPRFLVEQGRMEEAGKSIAWLYGIKDERQLSVELSVLKISVEDSQAKTISLDRVLLKMSVLKPILICLAIMFFYSMSAIDAITFYTMDIFESTGTSMDSAVATIILGVVQVVASLPAAFIVDYFGRRPLLLISQIAMCISLIGMGLFYYLNIGYEDDPHVEQAWLPLTALISFLIAYSIGIGPLCMILLGEVVPSHVKGLTSCAALMVRWTLGFGVTNLFKTLEDSLGIDGTYWLFAGFCGLGAVFVYYCIPETKGRSLDDIQTGFIHKSKLRALAEFQNNNNVNLFIAQQNALKLANI